MIAEVKVVIGEEEIEAEVEVVEERRAVGTGMIRKEKESQRISSYMFLVLV